MIADIESGKINTVITKDLSRLGRDYLQTGYYTDMYFPSKRVRYIAISDGIDTSTGYNEMAPFKNLFNDFYARDISKKIRSTLTTKEAAEKVDTTAYIWYNVIIKYRRWHYG